MVTVPWTWVHTSNEHPTNRLADESNLNLPSDHSADHDRDDHESLTAMRLLGAHLSHLDLDLETSNHSSASCYYWSNKRWMWNMCMKLQWRSSISTFLNQFNQMMTFQAQVRTGSESASWRHSAGSGETPLIVILSSCPNFFLFEVFGCPNPNDPNVNPRARKHASVNARKLIHSHFTSMVIFPFSFPYTRRGHTSLSARMRASIISPCVVGVFYFCLTEKAEQVIRVSVESSLFLVRFLVYR